MDSRQELRDRDKKDQEERGQRERRCDDNDGIWFAARMADILFPHRVWDSLLWHQLGLLALVARCG